MLFEDKVDYWLSKDIQGSENWLKLRLGSINSSQISNYSGRSQYQNSPKTNAEIICGISNKSYSLEQQKSLEIGIVCEKFLRMWYEKQIGQKIFEIGLGIWKIDPIFRGSLDGIINNEICVEFKIPKYMPKKLINHAIDVQNGIEFDKFYHDHIKNDNYDQMQANMVIHNMKFCDYIVYSYEEKLLYFERIPLNEKHFYEILYPKSKEFYNNSVIPLMEILNIKRIDP